MFGLTVPAQQAEQRYRPKRRKIQIACELCRLRKSKCDGGRPKCGACVKRRDAATECVYYELSAVSSSPKNGHRSEEPIAQVHLSDQFQSDATTNIPLLYGTAGDTVHGQMATINDHADDHGDDNDWMLQAGLLASSNSASFFKTVFGRVRSGASTQQGPSPLHADATAATASPGLVDAVGLPAPIYRLPSRSVTDALLKDFFKNAFIVWLDRLSFMDWYNTLGHARRQVRDPVKEQINHAVINIMFALEQQNRQTGDVQANRSQAQAYGKTAETLLQLQVSEVNREDLLWALLLLIQWYQSTNQAFRCRQTVSLCISIAKNLRLDDSDHISTMLTQRGRETSLRLWHACVLMDRITSMVTNRPLQIPQSTAYLVPFFRDIDDEDLDNTAYVDRDGADLGQHTFFLSFCRLHQILGDIHDYHIRCRDQRNGRLDVGVLMDTEMDLEAFKGSLPAILKVDSNAESMIGPQLHLSTRFWYIKVLLFRPCFLEASVSNDQTRHSAIAMGRFSRALYRQGQIECVNAARDLIGLLASKISITALQSLEAKEKIMPQWWHTVTYVYTASTVIIAALSFPALISHFGRKPLQNDLSSAFSVLADYREQTHLAERCQTALEALARQYDKSQKNDINADFADPGTVMFSVAIPPVDSLDWLLDESFFSFMDQVT
ncbi:uncharacterized protein AB675_3935 [Cyphellophora attinorum]|uniref:Zn(2)-C6 fungal-type domain-containing protein n=1 Tax=Cyphellophora attinorum TaxID=1664694 RepID=A0A0N0NK99_9EURO|nr:uncharacterized protein AB675_3935 [Phialophora attinorum]KPI37589.1 hypothetical protein AB675_3935 [Phialophora attinorum]